MLTIAIKREKKEQPRKELGESFPRAVIAPVNLLGNSRKSPV